MSGIAGKPFFCHMTNAHAHVHFRTCAVESTHTQSVAQTISLFKRTGHAQSRLRVCAIRFRHAHQCMLEDKYMKRNSYFVWWFFLWNQLRFYHFSMSYLFSHFMIPCRMLRYPAALWGFPDVSLSARNRSQTMFQDKICPQGTCTSYSASSDNSQWQEKRNRPK